MRAESSASRPLQRGVPLTLSVLLAFAAASCRRSETSPPAPGVSSERDALSSAPAAPASAREQPPLRPQQPLNVLLLTIDSLRADMPWAGYPRPIAPHLTELAKSCAVYDRAYSAASYTAQSVATFLSGQYASTLYRTGQFFTRYSDVNVFLPELMQERGIRTLGWHGHMYFAWANYRQGFDEWQLVKGIKFDPQTDNDITGEKMADLGIEILGKPENSGEQFFAFAHFMDPHDQYLAHRGGPDFGRTARDRYDGEIHYTDQQLHRLLEWARQQPWWERTALIITSDHGEAFGEHGLYRHAFRLYDVLVRVPWLVCAPGVVPRRIGERRSHIDLGPTILDLMGLPPKHGAPGRSLVPELYGATPENREPIVLELVEDSHNPSSRALIEGDYKVLEFDRGLKKELFNLSNDPEEEHDLSAQEPDRMREMLSKLEARFSAIPSVAPYGGNKLVSGRTANGPTGPAPLSSAR